MASNLKIAKVLCADELAALVTDAAGGKLRIYGTPQPANCEASIGAATLLAELTMPTPSFTVVDNVATAGTIVSGTAVADGTAVWFRLWKSDGTTALIDGTCALAASSPDLVIASATITTGDTVTCSSLTVTLPIA